MAGGVKPIKLNSMTGAKWGEKGSLQIPVGPTYEEIIVDTNARANELERVSITLNGDEIYILSGSELVMLEKYKQRPQTNGLFIIPFSDITARTKNGVRYTGLVTELGDNITLDIQFKAKASGDDLSIQCWAYTSERQPMRVVVPKIRKQTMQASAQGENEFTSLVASPTLVVRRMHFQHADINKLKVYRDFVKEHEVTRHIATMNAARNERTWQAGYFHFDPIVRGFSIEELFPTVHASELKFTLDVATVAGSIPILVESVEVVRPEVMAGNR